MKKIIKIIFNFFGWKLIKIQTHIKKPKEFAYPKPNIKDFEILLKSSGILHLGAHRGSEAGIYNWFNKNVLWIEAIPEIFEELKINISYQFGQKAICALLGDEDKKKMKFYLSNNDKASSSIYNLSADVKEENLWKGRNIKMNDHIFLEMRTLDSILDEHKIAVSNYDHWVVDLQGAEMIFLKGAARALKDCKSISIEVSKKKFYEGGAKWEEIKGYLKSKNFNLLKEPTADHSDVLFTKN
tara:strand:+ start:249 stop:971 length:723 start_codon:yes stop_codon:yes gene_type:complete